MIYDVEKYKMKKPPKYASKEDFLKCLKNNKEHILKSMEKAWCQYKKYGDRQWVVIFLDRYQVPSYVVDYTLGIKNISDVHPEKFGIPLINLNYTNCNTESEPDYEELWANCIRAIEERPKIERDYTIYVNPNEVQTGQISLFG